MEDTIRIYKVMEMRDGRKLPHLSFLVAARSMAYEFYDGCRGKRMKQLLGSVHIGVDVRTFLEGKIMKMMSLLMIVGIASIAAGGPVFYVAPNTYGSPSSTLDVPWQAAVGNSFMEFDLDGYDNAFNLDQISQGGLTINVGLGGLNGAATTADIFAGGWGEGANGSFYGTVYNNGLLNRDAADSAHGDITFAFSTPVRGFGVWVFDNTEGSAESFQMTVKEVGGGVWNSSILESGNGTLHYVEGWLVRLLR